MKRINSKIMLLCIFLLTAIAGCETAEGDINGSKTHKQVMQQKVPETNAGSEKTLERAVCPEFTGDNVRNVRVTDGGNILWEIDYMPKEDRASYLFWDIKIPYNSCAIVDTENMFRLYNRIASLDFHAKTETSDTSVTGLLNPEKTVTLDYYRGNKETAANGTKPAPDTTFTLLIGKENGEGQYFCALKGYEKNVLLLDQQILDEIFAKNPYDLILKIPYVVDISTVSEVHIQAGDRKYTMKSQDGNYMLGKKRVKQKEYSKIYQALMQPMIVQELNAEKPSSTDRQAVLSIEYKRSDKLLDDLKVHFYKYDEKYDSVNVNGNEFFLVNSQEVEQLQEMLKKISDE